MNCEEFMLLYSSENQAIDSDASGHLQICENCNYFVNDLHIMNNHLINTLEVPVPADLDEKMQKVAGGNE